MEWYLNSNWWLIITILIIILILIFARLDAVSSTNYSLVILILAGLFAISFCSMVYSYMIWEDDVGDEYIPHSDVNFYIAESRKSTIWTKFNDDNGDNSYYISPRDGDLVHITLKEQDGLFTAPLVKQVRFKLSGKAKSIERDGELVKLMMDNGNVISFNKNDEVV